MSKSITSVADLLAATNELQQEWNGEIWWRGQSSAAYLLVPRVYRINRGVRAEQNLSLRFRQYAQTRYEKCPPQDDFCSWLFLAQHYGLPTRLLDWSESPLGDFRHTPQIIRFSDRLVGNLCFEGRPPDFHWFDPNHNDGCGACQFHRGVRQTTL